MRVALTGGATGIGAEVAVRLTRLGHNVTVFDIAEPASSCEAWIQTDMGDPNSIKAALASASGPYDALINNVGLPPRDGLEHAILHINYFGLMTFLNGMLDKLSDGASIVNTASRAGAMWRENLVEVKALMALSQDDLPAFINERQITPTRAYNLSKEAVIVMTMARAEEIIARGFRMNSVSPAAVSTGILDDFATAFGEKMAQNVARVGRPGLPSEIAEVTIFMAQPQSHWIKGQDIVIDGGMGAMAQADTLDLK